MYHRILINNVRVSTQIAFRLIRHVTSDAICAVNVVGGPRESRKTHAFGNRFILKQSTGNTEN